MNLSLLRLFKQLVAVTAIGNLSAHSQLPLNSLLKIERPTSDSSAVVTVADPCNHIWVWQSTSELQTWTNLETWKVHNGNFHRTISTASPSPRLFYRTVYDPTRVDLTNKVATALLLLANLANYANPILPGAF